MFTDMELFRDAAKVVYLDEFYHESFTDIPAFILTKLGCNSDCLSLFLHFMKTH